MLRTRCDVTRKKVSEVAGARVLELNGRDLREAGQVLGVGDGGDELDGAYDWTGGATVGVCPGHTGTGGTRRVGVMKGRHGEGARVPRVGMLSL